MDLKKYFKDNYEALSLTQPFTDKEEQNYSKNDRDFIRYMQIMFNTSKKDAIKKWKKTFTRDIEDDSRKDF